MVGQRPLALLEYVPGSEPDYSDPQAQALMGEVLGQVQATLREECRPEDFPGHGWRHLLDHAYELAREEEVRPEIERAFELIAKFESRVPVSSGVTLQGPPDLLVDSIGNVGIVDLAEVGVGVYVYDLAAAEIIVAEGNLGEFPVLRHNYLKYAPVRVDELEGLDCYKRLWFAGNAWFYAHQLKGGYLEGDRKDDPAPRLAFGLQRLRTWPAARSCGNDSRGRPK